MGAMDNEIDYVHGDHEKMRDQRKTDFAKLEKNMLPRINALLVHHFPDSESNTSMPIDKATNEQLFAILNHVKDEFDEYTKAVKQSDKSKTADIRENPSRATKRFIEDRWGGNMSNTKPTRPGRLGFIQAMLVTHSAIGSRIKNNHSVDGTGNRVDSSQRQEWNKNKEKLNEIGKHLSSPTFLYDANKAGKNIFFGTRLTPNQKTISGKLNFNVNLSEAVGESLSALKFDIGMTVSRKVANIPIISRTGTSIVADFEIPAAGLSVAMGGNIPTGVVNRITEKLHENNITENFDELMQSFASSVTIGPDFQGKAKVSIEYFKPREDAYPDDQKKYTRVAIAGSVGASANAKIPVDTFVSVTAGGSAKKSITGVVYEGIGNDSLNYILQRYTRLNIAEPDELSNNPRFDEILEKNAPQLKEMLIKAADIDSNMHHEIFDRQFTASMKTNIKNLLIQLKTSGVGIDADTDNLQKDLNNLLTIRRDILHEKSSQNQRQTLAGILGRQMTNDGDHREILEHIDNKLSEYTANLSNMIYSKLEGNDNINKEKNDQLKTLADNLQGTTGGNKRIHEIANAYTRGEAQENDYKVAFKQICEMHRPVMERFKEEFKQELGFQGKPLTRDASSFVHGTRLESSASSASSESGESSGSSLQPPNFVISSQRKIEAVSGNEQILSNSKSETDIRNQFSDLPKKASSYTGDAPPKSSASSENDNNSENSQ